MKKLCIHGHPKRAQWGFWLDCIDVQADLNLCWAHMSKGTVSDVEAQKISLNSCHKPMAGLLQRPTAHQFYDAPNRRTLPYVLDKSFVKGMLISNVTRGPRATVPSPEWHSHCRHADVMQHFSNPIIATNENIIIWAVLSFEEYMCLTVNGAWSFE